MKDHGLHKTLVAIGGDSSNVNTGWRRVAIQNVEKKLGRKLVWLICYLHTNELPLRHLISTLNGPKVSYCGFSGTLGKALANITDLPIGKFEPVTVGEPLIQLSQAIVEDLTNEQSYGFQMSQAIRARCVPVDLALM